MSKKKLFQVVTECHDSKGRVVFVCTDENGLYVYKPQSGFRSRHYKVNDPALQIALERQVTCGHANAFYEAHELPLEDEQYPAPVSPKTQKEMDKEQKEFEAEQVKKQKAAEAKQKAAAAKAKRESDAAAKAEADAIKKAEKANKLAEVKAAKAAAKKNSSLKK